MNLKQYLSAAEFPWKVIRFAESIRKQSIPPRHLQLYPTNRCNANCSYCSCSLEDRKTELPYKEIRELLGKFAILGTKALTLSGGGEPTLHRDFPSIINAACKVGLQVGLATNGIPLARSGERCIENTGLTWCRISILPTLTPQEAEELILELCSKLNQVDLGVSMVIDAQSRMDVAELLCHLANQTAITHVRFVQEIFSIQKEPMEELERRCTGITEKAIFQWRSEYTPGFKECYMARLKPLVAATGLVYPCCGVQYAVRDDKCLPEEFSLGSWKEYGSTTRFDGSKCQKCYYWQYNTVLGRIVERMDHELFL